MTDCGVEDEPQNFSDEAKMMRGFVERFSDSWDRLFTDDMCMAPAEDPIHNKEQEVTIRHPNHMKKKCLGQSTAASSYTAPTTPSEPSGLAAGSTAELPFFVSKSASHTPARLINAPPVVLETIPQVAVPNGVPDE